MRNNIFGSVLISRRTLILGVAKIFLLMLLVIRMFYMQFIKKDQYKTLSDKNRIKMFVKLPSRGKIIDSNQQIIANNKAYFRLLLDTTKSLNYINEINIITKILKLDREQIDEIKSKIQKYIYKKEVVLIERLNWYQVVIIEENRDKIPIAIVVETALFRYYPVGLAVAHLVGYVGRVSNEEDRKKSLFVIDSDLKVGKSGIEKYYEDKLRGKFGYKQIEVNAYGQYVRDINIVNSVAGGDINLNIDSELQQKIIHLLSDRGCSAIVMDCTDGKILIAASSPSFDPNLFNNLSRKYWNTLINDPYKPLVNKICSSLYSPGSIFKIVTALAALEAGLDPEEKIECTGQAFLNNMFRCSSSLGHGEVNMIDALKYSCNHYIYSIIRKIGLDLVLNTASKLGLGKKTGIDLPGELSGIMPNKKWKQDHFSSKWSIGDSYNLSIGQGFLLCTSLQLVRLIAAIANNGILLTPQIGRLHNPIHQDIAIKKENLAVIKTALYLAMNQSRGTGYSSRINYNGIEMAGKTGTVQVQSKKNINENLSSYNIDWHRRNHAVFSGFAPFNKPKYAINVFFDHGGSGGRDAAPIASKIMLEVLKKYA